MGWPHFFTPSQSLEPRAVMHLTTHMPGSLDGCILSSITEYSPLAGPKPPLPLLLPRLTLCAWPRACGWCVPAPAPCSLGRMPFLSDLRPCLPATRVPFSSWLLALWFRNSSWRDLCQISLSLGSSSAFCWFPLRCAFPVPVILIWLWLWPPPSSDALILLYHLVALVCPFFFLLITSPAPVDLTLVSALQGVAATQFHVPSSTLIPALLRLTPWTFHHCG